MHELGLMTGVMDAAVEAAREAGATRLLGVKVSIGEATEAVEDALVFAFEALVENDPFLKDAQLEVNMIRPKSRCLECGAEFRVEPGGGERVASPRPGLFEREPERGLGGGAPGRQVAVVPPRRAGLRRQAPPVGGASR